MVWTEAKDTKLLRAMGSEGVFINSKPGSRERGAAWANVVSALLAENIQVPSRAARDRYQNLSGKYKTKMAREERESGGGDEQQTELDILLEELVTLEEEAKRAEEQDGSKKEAAANDKKQALEMRDRAQERFGETRKRHAEEKEEGKKETKRRRSGGEALEWLKEKGEVARQIKEQEAKERKEEREVQQLQHELFMRQLEANQTAQNEQTKLYQQQMLQLMQQQQQQHQQQQQQFAMRQHQMMVMMQSIFKKNL